MNGSHGGNTHFIVRLRGVPWNTSQNEIQDFLQGCKIRQTQFTTHEHGRTSGECFVTVESKDDVDLAKAFHQTTLGTRPIDVSESNPEEMAQTLDNTNSNDQQSNAPETNSENWREPVVRLRGLPYNSSKEDVTSFFNGLDIAQNGVHISSSKPAGEAFVAFMNMDNALRALEFNRMNMGHRYAIFSTGDFYRCHSNSYIEVFKSTYAEARASIMNDTQSMARQRGNGGPNQNYGSQRQHSGPNNYMRDEHGGGYNNNYNHQFNGPSSNNHNAFGGDSHHSMNNQNAGGGVKRPMSVSFTMKIRGVPFEAGEKEVFEFFSPVVPIRLEQENTPRGKPPIWYAEFGSREEATEALTFHKKYMGTRYIELLPLYDDGNRSKMART